MPLNFNQAASAGLGMSGQPGPNTNFPQMSVFVNGNNGAAQPSVPHNVMNSMNQNQFNMQAAAMISQ